MNKHIFNICRMLYSSLFFSVALWKNTGSELKGVIPCRKCILGHTDTPITSWQWQAGPLVMSLGCDILPFSSFPQIYWKEWGC